MSKPVTLLGGAQLRNQDPTCDPRYLVVVDNEGPVFSGGAGSVRCSDRDLGNILKLVGRIEASWVLEGVAGDAVAVADVPTISMARQKLHSSNNVGNPLTWVQPVNAQS